MNSLEWKFMHMETENIYLLRSKLINRIEKEKKKNEAKQQHGLNKSKHDVSHKNVYPLKLSIEWRVRIYAYSSARSKRISIQRLRTPRYDCVQHIK